MTICFEAPPFYREMTPSWICSVMTALGRSRPDIAKPYRFCVIGRGMDFHLAALAAANPTGWFVGIDADPVAGKEGASLARKAGLENLEFMQKTLPELVDPAAQEIEPFDFIVIEDCGVRFGDGGHPFILSFVQSHLNEGGVALFHYATDPLGAFLSLALEMIHRDRLQDRPGTREGLMIVDRMAKRGAAGDRSPLALFSGDMLDLFQGRGLTYVGSSDPLQNIDSAYLPDAVETLLAATDSLALREALRDIVIDAEERFDLYQKGGEALLPTDHMADLGGEAFIPMPGAPQSGPLAFETPTGTVEGAAEMFSPILEALAWKPQSLGLLMRLPDYARAPGLLNQAFQMLLWADYARPLLPRRIAEDPARALNRMIADSALAGRNFGYLAAPALGSAVVAPPSAMIAILALEENPGLGGAALRAAVADKMTQAGLSFSEKDAKELSLWEMVVMPRWVAYGLLNNGDIKN